MLRYLYPLIILLLVLLFCGCIPQPFSADSMAGPLLMVLSVIVMTFVWPIFIGHRLHEPSWRKLAERLHLSYESYGKKRDNGNKAARIAGIYRGRVLNLTTWRVFSPKRSRRRVSYDMALTLAVNVPARYKMHFRTKPRFNRAFTKQLEREKLPQSGYAQLDQRFVFYLKPEFVDQVLAETNLAEKLPGIGRGNRFTSIELHNQELRFKNCNGLIMWDKTDIKHMRRVIDVKGGLALATENVATTTPI